MQSEPTPNVYCVRAAGGKFTDHIVRGGYVAIGWFDGYDLSSIKTREEIKSIFSSKHPHDTNATAIGINVGQINKFLFDIQPGDILLTPEDDSRFIRWGTCESAYYFAGTKPEDGCRYSHRLKVAWNSEPLVRASFSVPVQMQLRNWCTVFSVRPDDALALALKIPHEIVGSGAKSVSLVDQVLNRLLQLDPTEFEILVTELLTSLGFDAQHVGKSGDEGVDSTGLLDIFGLAKVQLIVQVKRYALGQRISRRTVMSLRQKIPGHAQGAFITTADFHKDAFTVAEEPGYPRIGLMNGEQLVGLLTEQWDKLPTDIKEKLGLRKGLWVD